MADYYRGLAIELRGRDYSEDEIREILATARRVVDVDGRPPAQVLGQVEDYAETFPARKTPRRDIKLFVDLVNVLLAVTVTYLIARLIFPAVDFGYRIALYGCLGVFAILSLVFVLIFSRKPPS